MRNLILTGGGTAGHCSPCLALLPMLEKHFDNIYYIGSKNGIEKDIVAKTRIKYFSIPTVKLRRSLSPKNLTIPFTLTGGIISAQKLLKQLDATVVFSKGGYVALPVAIAAGLMRLPLVLHESDLTMGLANKISARFAREILTTFPQTAQETPKALWTGSPINPSLFGATRQEGRDRYGFASQKPVLLVMGGSSGSMAINREIRALLQKLTQKYNVLHLCGRGNIKREININGYVQLEFETEMKYAYAVADIAISRAGSNAIFELIAMKIPALLIPLPKAESRGDQIENADYFTRQGMFKTLLQEELTPQKLIDNIDYIYKNRLNLTLSQQKYNKNANHIIAERILRASLSK